MNQLGDRMAMAMIGDIDIGCRGKEESSIAEEYELVNDQLQRKREFYEAGRAEDSDINDKYSESGTVEDMPSMVGRMKDDASSDDSSRTDHMHTILMTTTAVSRIVMMTVLCRGYKNYVEMIAAAIIVCQPEKRISSLPQQQKSHTPLTLGLSYRPGCMTKR